MAVETYGNLTLASFGPGDGTGPAGNIVLDATGRILGTTAGGFDRLGGTVYAVARTVDGSGTVTTLATFDGPDGLTPSGGLSADAAGNLFGTTQGGGGAYEGTVFEIAKTPAGYGALQTIASLTGDVAAGPASALIAGAAGDLFGTGAQGLGSVFDVPKTPTGYGTPVQLASFDGLSPQGSLIADAAGDLIGTTVNGPAGSGLGTIFELPKTASGFGPVVTLASLGGNLGMNPESGLVADAAGDLFGTTIQGGAGDQGTVFELPRTASGYGTPTVLAAFDGSDGGFPFASLTLDAKGDLFGTTTGGGATDTGTLFEIGKTATGYGVLTTLMSFTGHSGAAPKSALVVDAAGDIYGTTSGGGAYGKGLAFELLAIAPPVFTTEFGATGTAGSAVTLSGTGLTVGTTVAVYNGATIPSDLVGTAVAGSDGRWSFSTTLAAGAYKQLRVVELDVGAGVTTVLDAGVALQVGSAGTPYAASVTDFWTSGNRAETTFYKADGTVYATSLRTPDGSSTAVTHAVAGHAYVSYTDTYTDAGVLTGTTYNGVTGKPYVSYTNAYGANGAVTTTTFNKANGEVYAILTPAAGGGCVVVHPYLQGPFSSITDTYAADGTLIGESDVARGQAQSTAAVSRVVAPASVGATVADTTPLLLDDPTPVGGAMEGLGSQSVHDLAGFSGASSAADAPHQDRTGVVTTALDSRPEAGLAVLGRSSHVEVVPPAIDGSGTSVVIKHA